MGTFAASAPLPVSAEAAYAWHLRPGALERLSPPWERIHVDDAQPLREGAHVSVTTRMGPLPLKFTIRHHSFIEGRGFSDTQERGPFRRFEHVHRFAPAGAHASLLTDDLSYALPLPAGEAMVQRRFTRLFRYRHATVAADLADHARWSGRPLRVGITGAHGLLGSALSAYLTTGGHTVRALPRPAAGMPVTALEGLDAVVHLGGENIASGRWSAARKRRIMSSRADGTRALSERIASMREPPRTLVCAAAVGIFGDRGDEPLTEESARGAGFLADVCEAWERASQPAREAGVRIVQTRFGVVLSGRGGAFAPMMLPFRFGLGGRLGSGQQYFPWILIDDALAVILRALAEPALSGPINVVSPQPITNRELTATLSRVLRRPALAVVPRFALRAALGQMADELLLASQRVVPQKLERAGHVWREPTFEGALRHALGRAGRS